MIRITPYSKPPRIPPQIGGKKSYYPGGYTPIITVYTVRGGLKTEERRNLSLFSCTSSRSCKNTVVKSTGPAVTIRYITDSFDDNGYFRIEAKIRGA